MKHEIKPTKGNINLMISINEVENLLKGIHALNFNYSHATIKKVGKYYYEIQHEDFIASMDDIETAKLYESDLLGLLNATKGFYFCRDYSNGLIDNNSKFRVELKKIDCAWEIDNE